MLADILETGANTVVRILLVDNHPGFLATAAQLLETLPGVEVVGQALSGLEAMEKTARLQPDLIFTDLVMPGMDGLCLTRYVKAQPHAPRIILVTLFDACGYREAALAAGADGFLAKEDFGEKVMSFLNPLSTSE